MNNVLRTRVGLALSVVALLSGCAVQPKPYEPPRDIPLQDPLPGRAIVYLLRAPYDSAPVAVYIGAKKLASIPPYKYTAISLLPGHYVLTTKLDSVLVGGGEIAPPFEIEIRENQRRFLNISGMTSKSPTLIGVLPIPGSTAVPLVLPTQATAPGSRSWKEVTELDAQGLMSISSPSLPERDAL